MIDYRHLLRQAYLVAQGSPDTSTKNGALLVASDGRVIASGYNSFTDETQVCRPWNYERPRKYKVMEHAERAIIYRAARQGLTTRGLTLVCPWASCPDCARGIVLAGITLVVSHKQAWDRTPPRWYDETLLGREILQGGNVEFQMFDGKIGGVENLFNREVWKP